MVDERDRRRDEALIEAGLVLASELSLPAVLQKIIELACRVADARYGALGVLGPTGGIQDFITHGITDAEYAAIGDLPEGHGILGALIDDAQPLRLAVIQDDPRSYGFPPNHPPMTTFLGVPIKTGERVFGNLYLTEKLGGGGFTEEDERAVVTLATQAAIAIDNARLYADARAQQLRLSATTEISNAILQGQETMEGLRMVARHARDLVGADLATVATPDGDDTMRLNVVEGPDADSLLDRVFPLAGSVSADAMSERRAILIADASADARAAQPIVALGTIGPAVIVPLAGRDHVFGTLTLARRAGATPFSDEQRALVELFATQASVVLEVGRVRAELERLAVVEDRERIAKELHDGIVQSLFAVGMSLQAAGARSEDTDMRERLDRATDDIDRAIRDLRNYIFGLRPGTAADLGLARALRDLAADYAESTQVAFHIEVSPEAAPALASRTPDLVQIAREALSNAIRHGDPSTVRIEVSLTGGTASLVIADDGVGFIPDEVHGTGHGLGNLRTRAAGLGGRLAIDTTPGSGTTVRVEIPV